MFTTQGVERGIQGKVTEAQIFQWEGLIRGLGCSGKFQNAYDTARLECNQSETSRRLNWRRSSSGPPMPADDRGCSLGDRPLDAKKEPSDVGGWYAT